MLLKLGSYGEDVKALQQKLGLAADGKFGSKTEEAVKKWQAANNLTADGIVGNATWNLLFPTATTAGQTAPTIQPILATPSTATSVSSENPQQIVSISTATPPTATSANSESSQQTTSSETTLAAEAETVDISHLKLERLQGKVPALVLDEIPECALKFQIDTPLRLAHFLAQCSHESGGFKLTQENLRYSADGLKRVFPKYFPGDLANSYARQPEKIASRVYANRMGNGDEASRDGYKYRGRGYIQLTGKSNYTQFNTSIEEDILENPDLVSDKYPLVSAGWYWDSRTLNEIADLGANDGVVTKVTKKVNGGTIGLAERIAQFRIFYALLNN
jgi:putative chitinase